MFDLYSVSDIFVFLEFTSDWYVTYIRLINDTQRMMKENADHVKAPEDNERQKIIDFL